MQNKTQPILVSPSIESCFESSFFYLLPGPLGKCRRWWVGLEGISKGAVWNPKQMDLWEELQILDFSRDISCIYIVYKSEEIDR